MLPDGGQETFLLKRSPSSQWWHQSRGEHHRVCALVLVALSLHTLATRLAAYKKRDRGTKKVEGSSSLLVELKVMQSTALSLLVVVPAFDTRRTGKNQSKLLDKWW
jgi:hypothetical protein